MNKKEETIAKMRAGHKLFQYKSFAMAGNSLSSKIIRGKDVIRYRFDDNTQVHHSTGNSLVKSKTVVPGEKTKTLGGWCTEMKLAEAQ